MHWALFACSAHINLIKVANNNNKKISIRTNILTANLNCRTFKCFHCFEIRQTFERRSNRQKQKAVDLNSVRCSFAPRVRVHLKFFKIETTRRAKRKMQNIYKCASNIKFRMRMANSNSSDGKKTFYLDSFLFALFFSPVMLEYMRV